MLNSFIDSYTSNRRGILKETRKWLALLHLGGSITSGKIKNSVKRLTASCGEQRNTVMPHWAFCG